MKLLPDHWKLVKLGEVIHLKNGFAFKSEDYSLNGIPLIRISEINDNKVTPQSAVKIPVDKANWDFLIESGDLLIAMSGATTGKTGIYEGNNPVLQNQRVGNFKIIDENIINKKWRNFYVMSLRMEIEKAAYGGAQPNISSKKIEAFDFPLAPFNEQKRIADKLDSMLARVDACRERLDHIPVILKRFRQAVLAAATSGKLTEEWRENCSLPFNWPQVKLANVASSRLGKMLDKNKNQGELVPYLRNINVRWFDFNLDDIQKIRVSFKEKGELDLRSGDVMICEGGEPGRCAVWRETASNFVYQKALHRVRVSDQLLPEYLCYVIKAAADDRSLVKLFTGTTIKHLTGISLNRFAFLLPPLQEQIEIVRRVEELFAYADRIEARYHAARARVDKLTPAILAKAFRGELAPQNPDDEPASVLLDRIQASRAANATTSKPERRRNRGAK